MSAANSEIFLASQMDSTLQSDLTRILNDLGSGDRQAVADLLPVVYSDLRRLADGVFRNERRDHTLQPTALVHEAYLQLMRGHPTTFQDRSHFYRLAAVIMRHLLVQHARNHASLKRGGNHNHIELPEDLAAAPVPNIDLVALDEALQKLRGFDERKAQIVELRFFAGLTVEEVAEIVSLSKRTIEDDWMLARAWLWREMNS